MFTALPENIASRFAEYGLGGAPKQASDASYQVDTSSLPGGSTAAHAGEDWNKFMQDWGPLIQKQMESLTDNSMVQRAEEDAARTPGQVAGAMDRALARRGGTGATQHAALAAARQYSDPLQAANTINNARIDQRTRNFDTAIKLSGLGTDVYQMGMDNIRESEGLAAQRKMNDRAASAAYKQNLLSGALTLGSAAAMAFL